MTHLDRINIALQSSFFILFLIRFPHTVFTYPILHNIGILVHLQFQY